MVLRNDRFIVPELQVLRGNIKSMFLLYECSVRQNLFTSQSPISPVPADIYFHKNPVSFSSEKAKREWLFGAEGLLGWHFHNVASHSMRGGAVDIREMESADVYGRFLDGARRSATKTWTALFFTYDKGWHYWGAVLKYHAAQNLVKIYVRSLDGLVSSTHESQTLWQSQKKLQRACRARKWDTRIQFHEWEQDGDVDLAFGWIRIWG
ncbi:hypothetical protein HBH98_256200 [Parastagonospora nodorum]|nr:hypothetical protein HBH53_264700 [Parastagonospora nodorum]KAH3955960.1 hypothetical protein HBH51_259490 [Parastagonospora nodorum]KAH4215326.1 hypothetical protein HBI06_256590 [Parastagonospora nodorum]KAH4220200.1 hypothetical protein HBI05_256830 [Parastagonospora nodorum]KAH4330482.1 hypothetical protein HBH98_256200 [Parastagonospora nodorum]